MAFGNAGKKLGVEAAKTLSEKLPANARAAFVEAAKDLDQGDVLAALTGDAVRGVMETLMPYLSQITAAVDGRRIVAQIEIEVVKKDR